GTSVRAGGRDKTLSERTAAYPSYRVVGERRRRTPTPPHLRMGAEWPRLRRQKRPRRKEQSKPSGRARRPTERGFKQAATAGRGTGRSVRRGISRSGGSNGRRRRGGGTGRPVRRGTPQSGRSSRRQRRRWGRGGGSRPSTAPHGAEVQTGSDGEEGHRPAGRVRQGGPGAGGRRDRRVRVAPAPGRPARTPAPPPRPGRIRTVKVGGGALHTATAPRRRSEEHTSELQSRENLVCRLLLEKKKT